MKFGKSLSNQIEETLPEWRDKFLSYKDLKKRLKLIIPKNNNNKEINNNNNNTNNNNNNSNNNNNDDDDDDDDRAIKRQRVTYEDEMTKEEVDFLRLLEDELDKFNSFFVEQEEEYIIRLKELQERVAMTKSFNYEEMLKIRKEIVDFHGEMVLLENYSALNYTGLVKILKKYDKRTGALIRLPFIQRVLTQPFFTTDLIYKLVKECERMLDLLFPTDNQTTPNVSTDVASICEPTAASSDTGILKCPKELAEIEYMESLYMKSTISALKALKEIRSKSSTVSMFSLPPLQLGGVEETWNKIPVLEQVAK